MELRRNLYSRPRPTVSSNRISGFSSLSVTMLFDRRNGSNQRTLMMLTRLLGNQDFSEKKFSLYPSVDKQMCHSNN